MNDLFLTAQGFCKEMNESVITQEQVINCMEVLLEKIEDIRIPPNDERARNEQSRLESLASILLLSMRNSFYKTQNAIDCFEKVLTKIKEPTSAATEISK